MMKIIKMGTPPSMTKLFKCGYCGCIFEATKDEYEVTSQLGVMHDGLPQYNAQCPTCNRRVYAD